MMAENVRSLYCPDADAMRQHLEHLFGGYLDGCQDGLIELAWTDTKPSKAGRYALRNAMMFGTDQIEELVTEATRLNSQPNCNVYIGAALRKAGTFPGGRADASDVLALTCSYVDLDDEGATAAAKERYGEAKAKPTIVVVTGRHPHTRAQMWWRLDEPITDQKISEALLKGMAAALGGDFSVTDPPRVMRLAGSIAWPVKPDRKIELTSIAPLREPGQPFYTIGHLARLFPPVYDTAIDGVKFQVDGMTRGANVFGMEDKVEDGRVEVGGLMAYSIDLGDTYRRVANLIDKILRGANPGDIPFYQPTKFELSINLKTAKALGLELPAMLLGRADEVIE